MDKQPGETAAEYLRRVGRHTDLPREDVEAVVERIAHRQFSPEPAFADGVTAPVEEFLREAESIGERDGAAGSDDASAVHIGPGARGGTEDSHAPDTSRTAAGDTDSGGGRSYLLPVLAVLGLVVVVGGALAVGGGGIPGTDAGSTTGGDAPEADQPAAEEGTNDTTGDEPAVVDSAAEAEGQLEVTDMAVDSTLAPDEEFVELTNVGDATLEMGDWTVRDREGGAVDARGVEPVTFPDGFTLESGESVRIVTGPGEDTEDTVHWGSETRNWHEDGDVIVVLDGEGEEVMRHEYGSPP